MNQRPAYFADKVYPSDPEALRNLVSRVTSPIAIHTDRYLSVLHVPHIDYMRGLEIYGTGYHNLIDKKYDVVFLLGTCHQYCNSFAIFTKQDFISPLGISPNATTSTENIINSFGADRALTEEHLHLNEHSLELQLPFLHYTLGSVPIVPVIIGSLHHLFPQQDRFSYEPYQSLVEALKKETERLDQQGKKYLFLAGVDMAHKGMFFGDSVRLTQEQIYEIANLDRQYLEYIEALDTLSLYQQTALTFDARRVCGFSTMMVICDIFSKKGISRFECLNASYKPTYDSHTDCLVSISSAGFYL